MTATTTLPAGRRRTWLVLALCVVVVGVVTAVAAVLTAPRPGSRLAADSTGPDGAHALVALLERQGVDVVVARTIADVERAGRPDALLLVAQTPYLIDGSSYARLAAVAGDRLLVEPTSATREALAPGVDTDSADRGDAAPGCSLPAAQRAGRAAFGFTETFRASNGTSATSCYGGALVRYRDGDRTVTVVGSGDFLTNAGLPDQGNAALAMNLAGERSRLIWYAPQRIDGETHTDASILELLPAAVDWIVLQLVVVVAVVALWQGRRFGPLVAEQLPVVVRASETVEGRGRLYRSRRSRDRAAAALRAATLQRLLPRLGLPVATAATAVVGAVAARTGRRPDVLHHILFGPPPATDDELVALAHELDTIERQAV
ncbi:DUF4350 domain-containing protein [Mycobacterium sp. MYCO198283]|uniref:DUF4350 domain-containing protein n=1 Tax=Mycobacterium sp. MYCO198283 TaxID=2883505 RepID=UPI001E51FACC|nr:DUF4350 domain-containing protein [Mycobacterium sp. MYCO198283]MCG5432840.1 DUF4350 domain-containing protein [Mycobacterium sp. MYCO198283]